MFARISRFHKKHLFIALIFLLILGFNIQSMVTWIQNNIQSEHERRMGNIVGWGDNYLGQMASENINRNKDGTFYISMPDVSQLIAGQLHSLALKKDGTVWAWGSNTYGQLGDGSNVSLRRTPVQVLGLEGIKHIATGRFHGLALKGDGTVWAWGLNSNGQIGQKDADEYNIPVQITGLTGVKDIAAGDRFSLALKEDGTVWAWGGVCKNKDTPEFQDFLKSLSSNIALEGTYFDPKNSELSDEDAYIDCLGLDYINITSTEPVQISGLPTVISLDGGYGHILALDEEGSVWSWGCNKYGQVGNGIVGNGDTNNKPHKVTGMGKIVQISAGYRHSLARDEEGRVWAWGHGLFGELGNNTEQNSGSPVQVHVLKEVSDVSAGQDYSLALDPQAHLWGWGENHRRILESQAGTSTLMKEPVRIKDISGARQAITGGSHAFVIY